MASWRWAWPNRCSCTAAGVTPTAPTGRVSRVRSGLGDTQLDRGIDYFLSVEDGTVRRAAFMRDRVDDVMVTRTTPPAAPELDHWLFEEGTPQASSVYDDPIGHDGDWSKSVFRLPNGMMAFTANSADEGRLATVPRGCIDFCSFPERNVRSDRSRAGSRRAGCDADRPARAYRRPARARSSR